MENVVTKDFQKNIIKVLTLTVLLFGANVAFAEDDDHYDTMTNYMPNCDYLSTVLGMPLYDETQKKNEEMRQVCIDMPVAVSKLKSVFNMDAGLVDAKGRPMGLRHMYMLGKAMMGRIKMGLLDPKNVAIVGVIHGSAMGFALNPNDYTKTYLDEIFKMKQAGLNINVEVCGVTMLGMGKTNDDLYKSDFGMIHINQGAIARIIDLEQHHFAYYQEDK